MFLKCRIDNPQEFYYELSRILSGEWGLRLTFLVFVKASVNELFSERSEPQNAVSDAVMLIMKSGHVLVP